MLPVNGSPLATPPFPRPGLDGLDSPASAVLRRRYDSPLRRPWRSWCSRPGSNADLLVRARRSAPARPQKPRRPGQFDHSAVPSAGSLVAWTKTGSPRFPGGPSHASAKLRDPGRTRSGKPLRQAGAAPAAKKTRAPAFRAISGLATWLQHSLSTLQELCRQAPARLASGWLASLCRAGFDPAEPLQQVSDHFFT